MSRLYIVATPIGNLADLGQRARDVLGSVDIIAAEDTRHSRQLLQHFDIRTRLVTLHDHNEKQSARGVLAMLASGREVALICDAGTPLISDPGFTLVRDCRAQGIEVVVVPGPSSVTAALSVCGLPTDRFIFEGFLPAKPLAREKSLKALAGETRTMVLFEAPHRIRETVAAIGRILGQDRVISLCRELTKTHEQVYTATAGNALQAIDDGTVARKGEFVVVVAGNQGQTSVDADALLLALMAELAPSRAAAVAAKVLDEPRKVLFDRAMVLKPDSA